MSRYGKAWVAVVGFIGSVMSQGLLPDSWVPWVTALVAGLTAAGVWAVPNERAGGVSSGV